MSSAHVNAAIIFGNPIDVRASMNACRISSGCSPASNPLRTWERTDPLLTISTKRAYAPHQYPVPLFQRSRFMAFPGKRFIRRRYFGILFCKLNECFRNLSHFHLQKSNGCPRYCSPPASHTPNMLPVSPEIRKEEGFYEHSYIRLRKSYPQRRF